MKTLIPGDSFIVEANINSIHAAARHMGIKVSVETVHILSKSGQDYKVNRACRITIPGNEVPRDGRYAVWAIDPAFKKKLNAFPDGKSAGKYMTEVRNLPLADLLDMIPDITPDTYMVVRHELSKSIHQKRKFPKSIKSQL